jgi:hypothetical protein
MLMRDMDKGAQVDMLTVNNGRRPGRLARLGGLGLILCGSFALASCHSNVINGHSPVYAVIDSLLGESTTKAGSVGTFSNHLASDVVTNHSVFEDIGQVTIHTDLRDVTAPNAPTSNNNVTFTHYSVTYHRTDGHNVQGVDVPYSFEGASTFTVPAGGQTTATFVLVRVQAKLEPPLINLAGGGGNIVISTIADVTFYGKDQTGTDVSVAGSLDVNFADWGDPSS